MITSAPTWGQTIRFLSPKDPPNGHRSLPTRRLLASQQPWRSAASQLPRDGGRTQPDSLPYCIPPLARLLVASILLAVVSFYTQNQPKQKTKKRHHGRRRRRRTAQAGTQSFRFAFAFERSPRPPETEDRTAAKSSSFRRLPSSSLLPLRCFRGASTAPAVRRPCTHPRSLAFVPFLFFRFYSHTKINY